MCCVCTNKHHNLLCFLHFPRHIACRYSLTSACWSGASLLQKVNDLLQSWILTHSRWKLERCLDSTFKVLEVYSPWCVNTLGVFSPLLVHLLSINRTCAAQETLLRAGLVHDSWPSEHCSKLIVDEALGSSAWDERGWLSQDLSCENGRFLKILVI